MIMVIKYDIFMFWPKMIICPQRAVTRPNIFDCYVSFVGFVDFKGFSGFYANIKRFRFVVYGLGFVFSSFYVLRLWV